MSTNTTTKTMALAPLDKLKQLDKMLPAHRQAIADARGDFDEAIATGNALEEIRAWLSDDAMKPIMAMQNTRLGFKTDNSAGYPVPVVRDVLIEAVLMRGVRPVGNEFNIIKQQCYITKEGYQGKIAREKPITDFRFDMGVPKTLPTGAIVPCKATWKKNGKEDSKEAEIPVRMDSGSTIDNILGKAERKFLKRVWEQMTGKTEPDGDVDDITPIKVATVTAVETPNFGNSEKGTLNV
jgi:hypothetical protein